jgi:hypothetical protein
MQLQVHRQLLQQHLQRAAAAAVVAAVTIQAAAVAWAAGEWMLLMALCR